MGVVESELWTLYTLDPGILRCQTCMGQAQGHVGGRRSVLAMTVSPRTGSVSGTEVITKCQQRQDGSRTHAKSSASLTKHDLSYIASTVSRLRPDGLMYRCQLWLIGIGYIFDEYSTSVCLLLYGLLNNTCINYLTPSLMMMSCLSGSPSRSYLSPDESPRLDAQKQPGRGD